MIKWLHRLCLWYCQRQLYRWLTKKDKIKHPADKWLFRVARNLEFRLREKV